MRQLWIGYWKQALIQFRLKLPLNTINTRISIGRKRRVLVDTIPSFARSRLRFETGMDLLSMRKIFVRQLSNGISIRYVTSPQKNLNEFARSMQSRIRRCT